MTFGISKSKLWENVLFSMNCMSKTFLENLSNLVLISLWLVLCSNCQCLLHPLTLNWTRSSFLGIIALFDLTLSNSFSATKSLQIQRPKSSHYLIKSMFVYFWIEMEWGRSLWDLCFLQTLLSFGTANSRASVNIVLLRPPSSPN